MPLQGSGAISMTNINQELNACDYSLRNLSSLAGKSTSDAMSEFYNYNGAYRFGSPQLVFDFNLQNQYSNSGTQIKDLSGNNNHGVFSTGTNNGTPATVTGYTWGYLSLPGSSAQRSVRIPDSLKPSGTNPFTMLVYMKPKGYSYNGNYPGIMSHGNDTIGLSWYLTPDVPGQVVWRDLNCGSNGYTTLAYQGAYGGLNYWNGYAITSNGTSQRLHQYVQNTLYSSGSTATSCGISTSSSWGFFLGLRYNMWLNADINYVAIYNSELTTGNLTTIFNYLNNGRTIGNGCNL
jgi:hypothetical protein